MSVSGFYVWNYKFPENSTSLERELNGADSSWHCSLKKSCPNCPHCQGNILFCKHRVIDSAEFFLEDVPYDEVERLLENIGGTAFKIRVEGEVSTVVEEVSKVRE